MIRKKSYHKICENLGIKGGGVRRTSYGVLCSRCGSNQFIEVHHKIPRKDGGSDDPDNLEYLCDVCHALAHNKRLGTGKRIFY